MCSKEISPRGKARRSMLMHCGINSAPFPYGLEFMNFAFWRGWISRMNPDRCIGKIGLVLKLSGSSVRALLQNNIIVGCHKYF